MGLRDDLDRFREVGEENRQDLEDFIEYGDMSKGGSDEVHIPIKIVDLPEFEYDRSDKGGVGQGQNGAPDVGQPVGEPQPQPGEGDDCEPGDEGGEHDVMDPEEFAEELDEELGLDLEPKGKKVAEKSEGPYKDVAKQGTNMDFDMFFKKGLKRGLAMAKDEEYLEELLKVDGVGPQEAFEWARERKIPVSRAFMDEAARDLDVDVEEADEYTDFDHLEEEFGEYPDQNQIFMRDPKKNWMPRPDDERYKRPEIQEEYEKNAVIINVRDVSGSMKEKKRELVERTFKPMDWYLQGKYDNAEFIYIAHDSDAWEVERNEFFGIKSGGGTKISSAYELAEELLEEYPWENWNRYVFAAGDSENRSDDTEKVISMMEEMPANLHAYVEAQPGADDIGQKSNASHAKELREYKEENSIIGQSNYDTDDWAITHVGSPEDTIDAIYDILSTETEE